MDFDFLWVLNDKDIKVELLDKVAFLSTKPKKRTSCKERPFFGKTEGSAALCRLMPATGCTRLHLLN